MNVFLAIITKVIKQRIEDGEVLTEILKDYPKLSVAEKQQIIDQHMQEE